MSHYRTRDTPPDNKSMTNKVIRAVVITGKYAVRASPREKHNTWPTDLHLDGLKCNWEEWNRRLNLVVDQRNFFYYLDGTFPCPDAVLHPRAA